MPSIGLCPVNQKNSRNVLLQRRHGRPFSSLLASLVALLLTLVAWPAVAAPDLVVGQDSGSPGSTVSLPIQFDNDGSVVALQFDLVFDAASLSPAGLAPGTAIGQHDLDWSTLQPGRVRVVITRNTPAPVGDGTLASFMLAIAPSAVPGAVPVNLQGVLLADASAQPVTATAETGGVVNVIVPPTAPPSEAVPIPLLGAAALVALITLVLLMAWLAHRRGLAGVTLSIALATVLFSSTLTRAADLPGDANDDGEVNAADIAVIVAQILEREMAPGNPDCNADQSVDVLDTVCLAQPTENVAPVLSPITNQQVLEGQAFTYTVTATDANLPGDVLTYTLDTAPPGMTIGGASGDIAWAAADLQLGTHTVTVRVTDSAGAFDTATFQLTVVEPVEGGSAPTMVPPGNRVVEAESLLQTTLFATDPDPGDVLAFSLDTAPAGMAVDATTGVLSWTPAVSALGSHPVSARVTDSGGLFDVQSFTVEVITPAAQVTRNTPPSLAVPGDQVLVYSQGLAVTATASDPDAGATLVFSFVNAPEGMTINGHSGQIGWSPTVSDIGRHDVTVQVTDDQDAATLGHFIVDVLDINRAPQASDDLYEARVGEPLVIDADGVLGNDHDLNGDALSAVLETAPAVGDLTLNPDGSFTYLLEPTEPPDALELELKCELSIQDATGFQTNATLAVGDVDNDGDIEIVGSGLVSGLTYMSEFWIMNADDCSIQDHINIEAHGGLGWETHVGLLDVDGDGDLELIGTRTRYPDQTFDSAHLIAVHHDGSLVWGGDGATESAPGAVGSQGWRYMGPSFADLDADGKAEIIMPVARGAGLYTYEHGVVVFNAEDGSLAWEYYGDVRYGVQGSDKAPVVADLDMDGTMEVIVQRMVLSHSGDLEFELPTDPFYGTLTIGTVVSAVANFDADPFPEVLARDYRAHYLIEHDGTLKWRIDRKANTETQLTVADFDGDGAVEYAQVGCQDNYDCWPFFLEVFDTDGSPLWSHEDDSDLSISRLYADGENIVAFDANRDGAMDLVYRNESAVPPENLARILIIDGRDGTVLESVSVGHYFSAVQSFVSVADVNNDGAAELVTSNTGGIAGETQIWGGTDDNPLPYAPPFRNQWIFNPTYASEDGKTMAPNPVPHWLQPGMNGWNMIPPEPDPLVGTMQTFTYVANDGEADSNVATVTLDVLPDGSPPQFVSEPDTLTTRGFPYTYAPFVVDPDLGDTVTFSLATGPDGMSLDPATGAISWAPEIVGIYPVSILAMDSIGFATTQQWQLQVGDPVTVPDVTGLAEAAALTALQDGHLSIGKTRLRTHPDAVAGVVTEQSIPAGSVAPFGADIDLVLSLGPSPADADSDGDGHSTNAGDCDDSDAGIHPGATDPAGDGIDQDCDGIDGALPVTDIVVEPGTRTLRVGESAQLAAFAIFDDDSAQPIGTIASWSTGNSGVASVSGTGQVTALAAGEATITAAHGGIDGAMTVAVVAAIAGDDIAPAAVIDSPVDNATITGPVDVIGTADDANLVRYRLELAPVGDLDYTLLAERNEPVRGGALGVLDPTRLLNGLYTLRLSVLDAGGNTSVAESVIQVDGLLKVGQFSLSYTDIAMPASGLPLELVRQYDNRDKSTGDFGVAWTLALRSARLHCTDPLGEGWHVLKSGLSYQLLQTRPHSCVVDIPGEHLEVFDFKPARTVSPIVPFSLLSASFVARPGSGTSGQLVNPAGNHLLIAETQPGPVTLLDDTRLDTFTPEQLVYTDPDGTRLVFEAGELVQMSDRAGNTLSIDADGIVHSSGRGLAFERDSAGRITRVTDPMGQAQHYRYSAAGDLVSHIDALGNETRYTYNPLHDLLRIDDPLGRPIVRNRYDDQGRLLSSTEPDGRVTTFSYGPDGRRQTVTDSEGGRLVTVADSAGNITEIEDALGGQVFQTFDAAGNRLSRTDENGNTTVWTWDARGNRLSETNPEGETWTWTYDANNNVTSETDPQGRTTTYAYNATGLATRRTNALDEIDYTLTYDAHGNITSRTDAQGHAEVFTYNAHGDMLTRTDARGHRASYQYDANGRMTGMTDRTGQVHQYGYDAAGRLLTETDPLGRTTSYAYDAAGQLAVVTDATGAAHEHRYDAEGNRVESEDALGGVTRWTFDARGLEIGSVSPGGRVSEYRYDALERRTRTRTPGGQDVEVSYDAAGRIVRQANRLGTAFTLAWDNAGRPAVMTAPDGTNVQLVFDDNGNLVRQVDPLGRETVVEYDALDRPVRTVRADGSEVRQAFDAAGNRVSSTDAAGNVTTMAYDGNGNLVAMTTPLGSTTRYEYDAEDRLVAVEDARGRRTTWHYNGAGQRTRKVYPDGTVEQWIYDAAGRLASTIDPDGDVTTYTYDLRSRLVGRQYADGSVDTFDWNADDQLVAAGNALGVTTYGYDAEGLLTRVENPDGSAIAYEYDVTGQLVSLTTRTAASAADRTTTFSLDDFGRLAGLVDPDGGVTVYDYDAAGNLVSARYPNGAGSEYDYDALNRLLTVRHYDSNGLVEHYDYTLDALGNRTGVTMLDGARVAYEYDAESRLLRESHFDSDGVKWHEQRYGYDAVGNRTHSEDMTGQVMHYTYNEADQLLSRGDTHYQYGPDGNLASRTEAGVTTHYGFDARNHLAEVVHPDFTVGYDYDARGHRVRRHLNGLDTRYLVGIAPPQHPTQVLAEYDDNGTALAENVFGNRLVSRKQGGTQSWAHIDGSLNTRLLTDATGSVTDRYQYDAFGNVLGGGAAPNPYRFAGERHGQPENLVHLRARDYDPQTGRLLSRDPFEGLVDLPLSRHRYQYGYQNPLANVDPSGEFVITAGMLAVASLVALAIGIGVNYFNDVKHSAKEFGGRTDKFRAKFCKGWIVGEGLAGGGQTVLIAEHEGVDRPQGPTSANYSVWALGAGWSVGSVGSNASGGEARFEAPGNRNVTEFEGTGKLAMTGITLGKANVGAGSAGGAIHYLPDGSVIPETGADSTMGGFSTTGPSAVQLTTFWGLEGKNNALFEGELDCFRKPSK